MALALLCGDTPHGQRLDVRPEIVRSTYTKSDYQIPMRDGAKLFTVVYSPIDRAKPYPILLTRTPYSVAPYGFDRYKNVLGPSPLFTEEGFIFVYQDVRGRMMSQGTFVDVRPHNPQKGPTDIDESTDTYDTIEWLLAHVKNHNGRVGMWGISYPGFYTAAGMIDAHPALKAVSPQAPIADWFIGDDFHHNGAFYLPHAFDFFSSFGRPRPKPTVYSRTQFRYGTDNGYEFYLNLGAMPNANDRHLKGQIPIWNDLMAHETYDAFWQARNLRPHLKRIAPAVLTVGGWFDAEDLFGALETYKWTEKQEPQSSNQLVMGPWSHGAWERDEGDRLGDVTFGSKTAAFYREKIELPFFTFHLKGKADPRLPEAYVFRTGANQWHTLDAWPPKDTTTKTLYFGAKGKLAFEPIGEGSKDYDEYISDPAKPVPYINYVSLTMTREYMVDDQRFAAKRQDVLTYQTEALTEDVTIAGPIVPSLSVSTSGTDSDWIVKVIDVYPAEPSGSRMSGYQQLVRGEPFRGKFRNSFEKPEPFVPNEPTKVAFTMPDVFHTFRRGHRIMVQIQSTWFPLVNRNPQIFTNINTATDEAYQRATQRVYHSSAIELSVWKPRTRLDIAPARSYSSRLKLKTDPLPTPHKGAIP
jgi:uncharacterized protein